MSCGNDAETKIIKDIVESKNGKAIRGKESKSNNIWGKCVSAIKRALRRLQTLLKFKKFSGWENT